MSKIISVNNDGWMRYDKSFEGDEGSGKINLKDQVIFKSHRSGWEYAIDSLRPLHNPETDCYFDGFLERRFAWEYDTSRREDKIPYRSPWIGFFHNPPGIPKWFFSEYSPSAIIDKPAFKESLKNCLGIYTLSNRLKDYLSNEIEVPICSLIHPTETPEVQFSFDKFLDNKRKRIINVGYWLRKLSSIYFLPIDSSTEYSKARLLPYKSDRTVNLINALRKNEPRESNVEKYEQNTFDLRRVSDEMYDELLSKNIVFLDLYDASASNTVIECIARSTPILINRMSAIEEYLGKDYPFYFDSLEDAAQKCLDLDLVKRTHEYLKSWHVRDKLSQEYFKKSFEDSQIYQEL